MIMTRSTLAARVAFHAIPGLRASLLVLTVVLLVVARLVLHGRRYRRGRVASVVPSTSRT
jgi:hypothetical protein